MIGEGDGMSSAKSDIQTGVDEGGHSTWYKWLTAEMMKYDYEIWNGYLMFPNWPENKG